MYFTMLEAWVFYIEGQGGAGPPPAFSPSFITGRLPDGLKGPFSRLRFLEGRALPARDVSHWHFSLALVNTPMKANGKDTCFRGTCIQIKLSHSLTLSSDILVMSSTKEKGATLTREREDWESRHKYFIIKTYPSIPLPYFHLLSLG